MSDNKKTPRAALLAASLLLVVLAGLAWIVVWSLRGTGRPSGPVTMTSSPSAKPQEAGTLPRVAATGPATNPAWSAPSAGQGHIHRVVSEYFNSPTISLMATRMDGAARPSFIYRLRRQVFDKDEVLLIGLCLQLNPPYGGRGTAANRHGITEEQLAQLQKLSQPRGPTPDAAAKAEIERLYDAIDAGPDDGAKSTARQGVVDGIEKAAGAMVADMRTRHEADLRIVHSALTLEQCNALLDSSGLRRGTTLPIIVMPDPVTAAEGYHRVVTDTAMGGQMYLVATCTDEQPTKIKYGCSNPGLVSSSASTVAVRLMTDQIVRKLKLTDQQVRDVRQAIAKPIQPDDCVPDRASIDQLYWRWESAADGSRQKVDAEKALLDALRSAGPGTTENYRTACNGLVDKIKAILTPEQFQQVSQPLHVER